MEISIWNCFFLDCHCSVNVIMYHLALESGSVVSTEFGELFILPLHFVRQFPLASLNGLLFILYKIYNLLKKAETLMTGNDW